MRHAAVAEHDVVAVGPFHRRAERTSSPDVGEVLRWDTTDERDLRGVRLDQETGRHRERRNRASDPSGAVPVGLRRVVQGDVVARGRPCGGLAEVAECLECAERLRDRDRWRGRGERTGLAGGCAGRGRHRHGTGLPSVAVPVVVGSANGDVLAGLPRGDRVREDRVEFGLVRRWARSGRVERARRACGGGASERGRDTTGNERHAIPVELGAVAGQHMVVRVRPRCDLAERAESVHVGDRLRDRRCGSSRNERTGLAGSDAGWRRGGGDTGDPLVAVPVDVGAVNERDVVAERPMRRLAEGAHRVDLGEILRRLSDRHERTGRAGDDSEDRRDDPQVAGVRRDDGAVRVDRVHQPVEDLVLADQFPHRGAGRVGRVDPGEPVDTVREHVADVGR